MRQFLFVLAMLAISINPVLGQDKKVEPGAPKEAPKPNEFIVKKLTMLIEDVPLAGPPTFPSGTVIPEEMIIDGEKFEKGDKLTSSGTAQNLSRLPKGMPLLPGTKLTLPPGKKLPEPPAPPKEPERFVIGKKAVTEEKLDDPAVQKAAIKYLLRKVAELDGRLGTVEKEVIEIKRVRTAEEKQEGALISEYRYDGSAYVVSYGGHKVKNLGYCSQNRAYLYQLYAKN